MSNYNIPVRIMTFTFTTLTLAAPKVFSRFRTKNFCESFYSGFIYSQRFCQGVAEGIFFDIFVSMFDQMFESVATYYLLVNHPTYTQLRTRNILALIARSNDKRG